MRKADISPNKQAEHSWRGSQLRSSHNVRMQERTVVGRLLNATIVICGACYILYIAVYLGLDLKSVVAKPLRSTGSVRLRLRTNPPPWEGKTKVLQLHSAGQGGTPDSHDFPHGGSKDDWSEKTLEEPVPGLGVLADETRAEPAKLSLDDTKDSIESSRPDRPELAAVTAKADAANSGLMPAGEPKDHNPWQENTRAGDSLKADDLLRDNMEESEDLLDAEEGKDSPNADDLKGGLGEPDLEREDDEAARTGSAHPAAKSAMAQEASAQAAEAERDPLLLESALAGGRDSAGSLEDAHEPSALATIRTDAMSAGGELAARERDGGKKPDPVKSDDSLWKDGDSASDDALQMDEGEDEGLGVSSGSPTGAAMADLDDYMIARMDDEGEFWEDDVLIEEDALWQSENDYVYEAQDR